jgi:hypothetical protein
VLVLLGRAGRLALATLGFAAGLATVIIAEPHRVHQAAVGFPRSRGSPRCIAAAARRPGGIVAGRCRWRRIVSSAAGAWSMTMPGLGSCSRLVGVAAFFALEL